MKKYVSWNLDKHHMYDSNSLLVKPAPIEMKSQNISKIDWDNCKIMYELWLII